MSSQERQMLDTLKELKEVWGVYAIKAEFEAEGARIDELVSLRNLVAKADLKFVIKIGGCEAIHDMNQSKILGADGIMAPMIETSFAMRKFVMASKRVYGEDVRDIEWIINAETKTCQANYADILQEGNGFLKAVTVGRSDLSASMGISRAEIETQPVYEATRELISMSKNAGFITNFGGNIGVESIPFILRMSDITDRFETRKVIIRMSVDAEHLKKAIQKALEFEYQYLINKKTYYTRLSLEDESRISRMLHQIETAK